MHNFASLTKIHTTSPSLPIENIEGQIINSTKNNNLKQQIRHKMQIPVLSIIVLELLTVISNLYFMGYLLF